MDHWTDRIVGDRMTVDQQFTDRVESSQFSRQQWGMVMTAIEFDIENPTDQEAATLVADTSALPSVIPELDSMDDHPMAGPGGPGGSVGDTGGGMFGGIKDALGLGSDEDDDLDEERLAAAERLADEYAAELQAHLEETGKWSAIRAAAAESGQ
ncbi:hypothetical protein BV210_00255 [Halorientalis sp. IM1011]|uniref:DUF5799 family protein n=1 Tax=Halorientalis sp. IM1011 TaxID=1932360 RepID=UPI00097CCDF1|nr:DUF5799 family protein [Halorientalis sp. IM1011]AQL41235.1 hypothetical protein BV210_00255 [Halorientalis sp. IM1011]